MERDSASEAQSRVRNDEEGEVGVVSWVESEEEPMVIIEGGWGEGAC